MWDNSLELKQSMGPVEEIAAEEAKDAMSEMRKRHLGQVVF